MNKKAIQIKKALKIGLEFALFSLDPRIGGEAVSGHVLKLLFEGLMRFNQEGKVENGVAAYVEISPNRLEYTFKLRDALWNDGTFVTAHDFEYAWKKILSPEFKTSFAYLFHPIKNAKEAKQGKISLDQIGIQVIDNFTLKVELTRPTPYFLQLTAHPLYSPVHRLVDQKYPEWPYLSEQNYPCNGPFQLKVNQEHGYHLIPNTHYWNIDSVELDEIILIKINPAQALHALQKKEIDWIGNPFGGFPQLYVHAENLQTMTASDAWVTWLVFNNRNYPFNNLKLRKAFAYAIDRAQVLAFLVSANPAYSPLNAHYSHKASIKFPEKDIKKAKKLFQDALEELRLKKEELPPIHLIYLEKGVREHVAHNIEQQFKECFGINIQCQPLPWNTLFNKMTSGDFQIGITHWISWVNDPLYTLNVFRSADQGINFAKWENEEYQRCLQLAEQGVDPSVISANLCKAEEVLCREMPVIPIFYSPAQALVSKDISVAQSTLLGRCDVAQGCTFLS